MIAHNHSRDVHSFATRLDAFVQTLEGTTSLALLRQIDETVDALLAHGKAFGGLVRIAALLTDGISAMSPTVGVFIDPDDRIVKELKATYESIEDIIPKLLLKKASIARDGRLSDSHCDLLHSAYDDSIMASGTLVEAMKDLRAAIIRHDLAAECRNDCATYEVVDDLVSELRNNQAP
jgi:hypothetical protein